ncbi:aspartate--tRNA ligase [Alicyclobacillus pomorum]|uniref:aspartate--tRNA ligase n=1 Tax=Alicyclobacillus pomorum TaxID=204470 RepID=UPI0004241173|nr:aspartate--tRNA ligase [Alicyclobacillus pomorum]
MTQQYRTHAVAETAHVEENTTVTLSGWVQRRRDLGSLMFVDLRDRSGIVQLVFDPERGTPDDVMQRADQLRNEYVITVGGQVVRRDPGAVNPKIATGHIEVVVSTLTILNAAKTPPFYIQDNIDVDESLRLKYRYLDLRRPVMQNMLMVRHKAVKVFRDFLDKHGFIEVETPMLTRSTPEGARDYLVPSRVHPGEFYALPQSPQLFKQLLMVSGLERYFQFARCFRDEDLRADRQPEFTQLDIEQSFIPLDEFQAMMEEMMQTAFREVLGVEIPAPFQRMPYREAMETYGSDKPDLRFGLPLVDISEYVRDADFRVFREVLDNGGVVKAISAPGCAKYSRKQTDELVKFVQAYGLKGLATIAVQGEELKSSIAKFFSEDQLRAVVAAVGAADGDLVLIAAADRPTVNQALGALRQHLARTLNLIPEGQFKFVWITDFPLLSYDEEQGRYVAEHHPFTMPNLEDLPLLDTDPGAVRAQAYDLVLNGFELGGGSMRIYQREIQEKMFSVLGFTKEQAYQQFGFLLDAFEYGTPPHGGIAFGIDRLIMIMGNAKSLRDCIAFPKTSSGTDLLTDAPSTVTEAQLETLHLELRTSASHAPVGSN